MDKNLPLRVCPICSGTERAILFSQRFEAVGPVSLLEGYDVVACHDCGFTFGDRIPGNEKFAHYYADASKYEFAHRGGKQQDAELERLSSLSAWISQHCSSEARLLDAGCATGELLAKLKERGFSDLTGLDPSPACVAYALKEHGLRVLQGVLSEKPPNAPRFDVVVLSAVLEHIPGLAAVLRQLESWITPEGSIVIEVPDAEHFAEGRNAPYQEFSVEHVNFFSLASLNNLMRSRGFKETAHRHFICPAGPGVTGSVLTAIFRKGATPSVPVPETSSREGIMKYLRSCEEWIVREHKVIGDLVEKKTKLFVWGTGTLCQRLLATTKLGQANIRAFVDSNPHYQGSALAGRPIIAPSDLPRASDEPILITSWAFFDEISDSIRHNLHLTNPILTIHQT